MLHGDIACLASRTNLTTLATEPRVESGLLYGNLLHDACRKDYCFELLVASNLGVLARLYLNGGLMLRGLSPITSLFFTLLYFS